MKKSLFFLALVFLSVSILTGCASIMGNNKSVDVSLNLNPEVMVRQEAERQEALTRQETQRQTEAQERQRAAETQRLVREEVDRYDPAKFTVVPSNFRPADYTSTDLFKAVSASRNLQKVSNKLEAIDGQMLSDLMFGLGESYVLKYKSDLTFVRQNGTDITFSSDDNAITQNMFIDQRSGLQAGQKVSVYYMITRSPLITWDVIAIERR